MPFSSQKLLWVGIVEAIATLHLYLLHIVFGGTEQVNVVDEEVCCGAGMLHRTFIATTPLHSMYLFCEPTKGIILGRLDPLFLCPLPDI